MQVCLLSKEAARPLQPFRFGSRVLAPLPTLAEAFIEPCLNVTPCARCERQEEEMAPCFGRPVQTKL